MKRSGVDHPFVSPGQGHRDWTHPCLAVPQQYLQKPSSEERSLVSKEAEEAISRDRAGMAEAWHSARLLLHLSDLYSAPPEDRSSGPSLFRFALRSCC